MDLCIPTVLTVAIYELMMCTMRETMVTVVVRSWYVSPFDVEPGRMPEIGRAGVQPVCGVYDNQADKHGCNRVT